MSRYIEYSGMSYEQASREAARLIKARGWFQEWDRLAVLREIMIRHTWRQ
jgi:hypothetical protein